MKFTRKEIWRHNGFSGTAVFAQKGLQSIIVSRTATKEAKFQAQICINELEYLREALKVKANAN